MIRNNMKKETKVIQDNKQTRSTIPQKFVDEFKVTNKDKVQWEDTRGMLRGRLIQEVNKKRIVGGERNGN
jgi:hypothetical protein